MIHYLINTSDLKNLTKIDEHDFGDKIPPILADEKKQKWVEVKEKTTPEYDFETQHLEISTKISLKKISQIYKIIPISADELTQNILRKRQDEYGDISHQLGMIYDDKINDTTIWQDHIAKVKADNPKIN